MIDVVEHPGTEYFSPARSFGGVMAEYMAKHDDFYLIYPDETTINKLDYLNNVSSLAWYLHRTDFDLT